MAFLDDIGSQGDALRSFVEQTKQGASGVSEAAAAVLEKKPLGIVLTGMGTSEHVGWLVCDGISADLGVPVSVRDAGELLHYGTAAVCESDVIVAVSQSGESVETRRLLEKLAERERPLVVSVTNDPSSSVARMSDRAIGICAGTESSISTKTYTNTLAALLGFRAMLSQDKHQGLLDDLLRCADLMDTQAEMAEGEFLEAARLIERGTCVYFVSRGPAMAAALQAALTFQEGCHVPACALTGGAFRHGPMELAGEKLSVVLFAPDDHGGELLVGLAEQLADLGSGVVLISPLEAGQNANLKHLKVPLAAAELLALQAAVLQERLLQAVADIRGVTPGEFRIGGKVTLTE